MMGLRPAKLHENPSLSGKARAHIVNSLVFSTARFATDRFTTLRFPEGTGRS